MWPKLPKQISKTLTIKLVVNFWVSVISKGIATPPLLCIWAPCCAYRGFVTLLAKVVRQDLGPILSRLSTVFTDENFFQNSPNDSVVAVLSIDGNLTLPQLVQLFDDNVICATRKHNSNELRYPELQQYPVNFLGHQFWKRDANFSLENHIREHEYISTITISKIHQYMLNEKFVKEQSPWQVAIFRNDVQTRTCLALRFQHCMLDGKSILKLIVECLGSKTLNEKEATFKKRTIEEKKNYLISLPQGIIQLNINLLHSLMQIQQHPWRRLEYPQDDSPLNVGISDKILLAKIKDIGRIIGVQTSAVILSVIVRSTEKFLLAKNNYHAKNLSMYLALPKKDHPEKLTNHVNIGFLQIPNMDDDIQRLRECDRVYHEMRVGDHPRHFLCIANIVATLPAPLRGVMTSMRYATTGLSNIAGDQEGFSVGGYPCLGFNLSTGLINGSIGVNFLVLSYKENIQVSVVSKSSILTERETAYLTRLVVKEFTRLSELVLG